MCEIRNGKVKCIPAGCMGQFTPRADLTQQPIEQTTLPGDQFQRRLPGDQFDQGQQSESLPGLGKLVDPRF